MIARQKEESGHVTSCSTDHTGEPALSPALLCTITSFFKGQGELQAVALPVSLPFQRQWATLALSSYPVTYLEQTTPIGLSHPDSTDLSDRIPITVNTVRWNSRGKLKDAGEDDGQKSFSAVDPACFVAEAPGELWGWCQSCVGGYG